MKDKYDVILNEKDIEIFDSSMGFTTNKAFTLAIYSLNKEELIKIKSQIFKWKEKAEKYDDLMQANNEVVQQNISLTQTHQENKKLKQVIEKIKEYLDESVILGTGGIEELKQLLSEVEK